MKKIVLIGPVYPYKGGIAHYTSLLYRTLAEKYEVEMISYKMQYPKLLFKKEQKDYSNDMFKVENAQFLIHTANPFNIIRVGKMLKKQNPDLVIMQWWHPYFAPCYRLLCAAMGKKIQKMFICHNVFPHERFPMDRFLAKMTLKRGDSFIVHSKSDGEDLLTMKPDAKVKQNPHPTYNAFKIRNLDKEQARKDLGEGKDTKLLLFFGFVREYKGLKHLLKAMPQVKEKLENVKMMVVGSFADDKADYMQLISDMQIGGCVELIDGYTPDNEVEKYFAACDVVVLPYESATQSGIVQIAYGFEKPVIVTNVGGLPDVVTDGKTGYVVEPKKPEALSDAIVDFYRNGRGQEFQDNVRQEAYRFSWERLREAMEELLQ
ncbi:MAG: glycosyltransferase [Lachnospiraceae bacterium]|nr:glycosyltransferase [Lachnospiraceae bacterium]